MDQAVLADLADRLVKGETIKPTSNAEKDCYQLIKDLDHIGGEVDGSLSGKKLRRNEVWSLIVFKGGPLWYIMLNPADVKHPICLYWAGTQIKFNPNLSRSSEEKFKLIANNPVVGACFFDFMVCNFIENVLGVGADHPELFGKTSAYYGIIEQQGCLTLHLHMLIWIEGSPSPEDMRKLLMDKDSTFSKQFIEYLEGSHRGEFVTGTLHDTGERVQKEETLPEYCDPTHSMPQPPPVRCMKECDQCD